MYKQIPENTFGKTPAAMYLARVLNEYQDESILSMVGRRINSTTKQVRELVFSYERGGISPKTLSNCLRLMRDEVSSERTETMDNYRLDIVHDLRKNVQIGAIKAALRLASVARKSERVMELPYVRGSSIDKVNETCQRVSFFDHQMETRIVAGEIYDSNGGDLLVTSVKKFSLEELEKVSVNAEILHQRSERRCQRLGKPHTLLK